MQAQFIAWCRAGNAEILKFLWGCLLKTSRGSRAFLNLFMSLNTNFTSPANVTVARTHSLILQTLSFSLFLEEFCLQWGFPRFSRRSYSRPFSQNFLLLAVDASSKSEFWDTLSIRFWIKRSWKFLNRWTKKQLKSQKLALVIVS